MAKTMTAKLINSQRRRILNMRRNSSTRGVMEAAVWNTLQSHTHLRPTAKGYVTPSQADEMWKRLHPFFDGDPELETRHPARTSPRRAKGPRMPKSLRAALDAEKLQRREDYYRRGTTYEGGPLHDPLYEGWLIEHGIDPLDYLNRFDPTEGWEAPPWAEKYGVVWPDPADIEDDWDEDEPEDIAPHFGPVPVVVVEIVQPRELVTA